MISQGGRRIRERGARTVVRHRGAARRATGRSAAGLNSRIAGRLFWSLAGGGFRNDFLGECSVLSRTDSGRLLFKHRRRRSVVCFLRRCGGDLQLVFRPRGLGGQNDLVSCRFISIADFQKRRMRRNFPQSRSYRMLGTGGFVNFFVNESRCAAVSVLSQIQNTKPIPNQIQT